MRKNKLELTEVYFMRYCVPGIMWIIYGILNLYDDNSMPLKISSTICMAFSILTMLASWTIKQDKEDDASHLHMMKACTCTLMVVLYTVMVISIVSAFTPTDNFFDFNILYPFILGIILVMIGGIFIYCEKWGDDTWL